MGIFTVEEIKTKLRNISKAQDDVLTGGRSYNLNDGMGNIQVTRENVKNLQELFEIWEARLNDLENPQPTFVSLGGHR